MVDRTWNDPHNRTLSMFLNGTSVGGQSLLIIFHGGALDAAVTLPARGEGATYRLVWDSAWERPLTRAHDQDTPDAAGDEPVTVSAASVRIYALMT